MLSPVLARQPDLIHPYQMTGFIHDLPHRMTTREVCALGRISVRTLSRRITDGTLALVPVDRAREKLFRREDVVRAFGMESEFGMIAPASAVVDDGGWNSQPLDPVLMEWCKRKAYPRTRIRLTKGLTPPDWFLKKDGKPPTRRRSE